MSNNLIFLARLISGTRSVLIEQPDKRPDFWVCRDLEKGTTHVVHRHQFIESQQNEKLIRTGNQAA
jgi:hypothetical protein